jgi:hypothetical protein
LLHQRPDNGLLFVGESSQDPAWPRYVERIELPCDEFPGPLEAPFVLGFNAEIPGHPDRPTSLSGFRADRADIGAVYGLPPPTRMVAPVVELDGPLARYSGAPTIWAESPPPLIAYRGARRLNASRSQ